MALSGHLSDLSLSELIEFFCNQRKTGQLKVLYPQGHGYFYLQSGSVVDARIGTLRARGPRSQEKVQWNFHVNLRGCSEVGQGAMKPENSLITALWLSNYSSRPRASSGPTKHCSGFHGFLLKI